MPFHHAREAVSPAPGRSADRVPTRPFAPLLARAYGSIHDAAVRGFAPYQMLLDEIAVLVHRSAPAAGAGPLKVLDVACATGTLTRRLARDGHAVVGVEAIADLVRVAGERSRVAMGDLAFCQGDVAATALPEAGTFDVLVSAHTLSWHPDPDGLLEGCRRALRSGGHAIFLTSTRRPRLGRTFSEVAARDGGVEGLRALRWLVSAAVLARLRGEQRCHSHEELAAVLARAGFTVIESRATFLGGMSALAWARVDALPAETAPVPGAHATSGSSARD